jgi:ABC-2 type transport system ATP-binding protein
VYLSIKKEKMNLITTKNLTKIYENGFKAVENLNLKVEEGDIYGFLGPNGAGKTTTIRMLTGLLKPSNGEVFINNINVAKDSAEIKKYIGVLPESHGYYNWMTGKEYLTYFSNLFMQDADKAKEHISYLLEKVGLSNKSNVVIGQYSRGMKQRLGIAKTLINHPKVIFLDEPTLGLDPSGQKDIHHLIFELNKSMNVTVFITSHMLKDIEVLCNKVAIVKEGKLLEQGTIKELQERYSGKYDIRIKTSDNIKSIQRIKNIDHIIEVEVIDEYINISLSKSRDLNVEDIKHEIIEKLFTSQIDIYEISKVKTTVEDIFFKLIADGKEELK